MSRTKLIKQLKEKNPQLTQSDIKKIINIISESISNALKKGNNVEIRGLGRWYCKTLKENFNARNPSTKELIYKPQRVKVKFRPSKNLKNLIND